MVASSTMRGRATSNDKSGAYPPHPSTGHPAIPARGNKKPEKGRTMAQPDMAAGGDGNPADANPATPFEDIAAEMLGADEKEEEQPVEDDAEATEAKAELSEDDLSEEANEPDLPAIDPPNSLTAEEKEAYKSLPREAQEFTARRIGELEKGFQTKAQETAQAREAARTEALQFMSQA